MHHIGQLSAAALLDGLSALFVVGGAGCIVVLVMTFWEDLRTVTGH